MTNPELEFLVTLESVIDDRVRDAGPDSYTASLIAAGPKRLAQKLGEEGVELALAAVAGDRAEVLEEAADLVYHLLVLLRSHEISLAEVTATLETRHTG
jgi:phosphoribosyl-ATP pyrophosphohydrolase/phosphoribosyl-AMP cyclohydrolase